MELVLFLAGIVAVLFIPLINCPISVLVKKYPPCCPADNFSQCSNLHSSKISSHEILIFSLNDLEFNGDFEPGVGLGGSGDIE